MTNRMSSGASRLYRERFDLGITDWRVLAYLGVEPKGTNAAICQLIGLDKAAVSRSVAVLEEKKLIRSTPVSGRTVELAITPKGRRVYEQILVLALAREEALLSGFTAEERQLVIRFLHRFLDNIPLMNAIGQDGANPSKPPGKNASGR
ncbi:MarR family winged helix-turn-helix transcriptional regulator [Roseomonas chloroacetimidivorans]|uniref:MarR family winged helix-turn-helix transcriptional regulator n=1 Tax=Roseomonas chloroacetimidivorans TaxID=1766656 RepID=UPI003C72E824